jgi:hypothetical protein
MLDAPSCNDGVTIDCPIFGRGFRPSGRRRYCSDACRQAAFRQRQPVAATPLLPKRLPRSIIIFECPSCETRYLGEQRCDDCGVFCRRIGPGGACPHCDGPVAVTDLIGESERNGP